MPARAARLFVLCLAWTYSLGAQVPPTEFEVKSAYLLTFGRFIQWPAQRDGAGFDICILGADPFGATLDATIAGATLRGRKVSARRPSSAPAATACDVLFISASEEPRLPAILEQLQRSAVLTVSDITQFAERGGMIQFVTVGKRVRFEINLSPARNAGLALGSELLRVASAVRGERAPGD
jgi:hypothetical protein